MKWKYAVPILGDERIERRMAWLPTKLDDGYTVWLETYRVHLKYESRKVLTKFFTYHNRIDWHVVETHSLEHLIYP